MHPGVTLQTQGLVPNQAEDTMTKVNVTPAPRLALRTHQAGLCMEGVQCEDPEDSRGREEAQVG